MTVEDWRRPEARDGLLRDFRSGTVRPATLGQSAITHLRANWPATDAALAADELLAQVLVSVPIYPQWLEGRLTGLRRRLLFGDGVEALGPLLPNLAIQCHLNEYAWALDAIERQLVERMAGRIERLTPAEVMAVACYRPLSGIPGADVLLARSWTDPERAVLEEQLVAAREEQALVAQIPAITPIRGGVSQTVRAQYEEHPYPRWRHVTPMPTAGSIFGWRIPEGVEVLFAGCGTGHHAIHAGQRYGPTAKVLAVDLSRASLAYALRKTRAAGIGNMTYAQADLLELGGIGRTFDVIECSGVLHHLADPFEGARVLSALLRPGGVMKIALYSAIARVKLGPAKALAKQYGPDTIRELRQAIIAAPDGDPVKAAMGTTDFYSTSSLRDLIMHVQEHEMAVADLQRMVDENGLAFTAFAIGAETLATYRATFPGDPAATDLANWDAFERANPTTFGGMYQFWVRKPA